MRKILLLYTGGTIGMHYTSAGLEPAPGLLPKLIKRLPLERCALTVLEYPDLVDSACITLNHWRSWIGDIVKYYEEYDGFVVIHGTDTMAFTGSMLAFALQGLSKPVVLTGSQLPLVHPRSDGWNNLTDAIETACQADLAEVVIVFDHWVIRACRARKWDATGFKGFTSPNAPLLGEFGIKPAWFREQWLSQRQSLVPLSISDVRVASFFLTPGTSASLFGQLLEDTALQGVILLTYGNGNVPPDTTLLNGVRAATERGVLLVNLTQATRGGVVLGEYAASLPLAQAGALSGADMTPEAALAKLTWLLSLNISTDERKRLLTQAVIGELTEP